MKINVLTLEDLSASQTDVAVPADLPEEELQDMKDDAQLQDDREAEEAARVEEQTESQSLIDQVVALEALYEKIGSLSTFPAELAMEAYDAAPDAYIMETYRSGASTGAKISVAMEGIMAKAWDAVKRFWAHLVQMWKKFMQYLNRFMVGKTSVDLQVDQKLVTQLEDFLHEGAQRFQHNQQNGLLVRDNPEEHSTLKRAWVQAGEGKMAEAFGKIKEVLPKSNQFVQVTEKYVRDLERWSFDSIKHPDAQTVMPASPESTMYDFVESCDVLGKTIRNFFLTKEYDKVQRVPLNAILTQIKATAITAEYGLERALVDGAFSVMRFAEKRNADLQKMLEKEGIEANKAKVYRALGQELSSLRAVVSDVFMLFSHLREAQARVLELGGNWLYAVHASYEEMASSGQHYSEKDKEAFRGEKEFFRALRRKYNALLDKKIPMKGKWASA
jgi:hypothetical protein